MSRLYIATLLIWLICRVLTWNASLDEAQAGIKTPRRNINNLRYVDHFYGRKWRELKSLLIKVKKETEKAGLKLNIQKTKIMASGPITSWQKWVTMETMTDFISLGSKITTDGDCSHEIKRHLLLERKAMTNLDGILKSRDITLPAKVHIVKIMVFQQLCMDVRVGLWRKLSTEELMLLNCGVGEDSWESLGLQRDPTSPSWRRSVLSVHWKDWCWSWKPNTLTTWCEELTHWKNPDAGKDWGQEEKGMIDDEMVGWHHWLNGHGFGWTPGVGDG